MRTVTDRLVAGLVTLTIVPIGKVPDPAVNEFGSETSPLAVVPPPLTNVASQVCACPPAVGPADVVSAGVAHVWPPLFWPAQPLWSAQSFWFEPLPLLALPLS